MVHARSSQMPAGGKSPAWGGDRRYQSATRIHHRVEEREKNIKMTEEHHPKLLTGLRETFGSTEDARSKRLSKKPMRTHQSRRA